MVANRPLHFRAYDILRDDPAELPTNEFAYKALRELGFLANAEAAILKSPSEIMQFADEWDTKRHDLEFNTDGLVVKINDRALVPAPGCGWQGTARSNGL